MVAPPVNRNSPVDPSTMLFMTVEGVPDTYLMDSSIASVTLVESLLTPSIHTTVEVQDSVYWAPDGTPKNLDKFKGKTLNFNLTKTSMNKGLDVQQVIYRIDSRKLLNMQIETYFIHAIDNDALMNASGRMAKAWVCQTPSSVVGEALACVGAKNPNIETSDPRRNYNATNIYPYQVISEQAEVALANGNDPSFVHFMTFENTTGRHNFRSLARMAAQGPIAKYTWNEKGSNEGGFSNQYSIMSYEFPCDFDMLSDLMNGVGNSSGIVENIQNGKLSIFGSTQTKCGLGAGLTKYALSDSGSSDGCDVAVEKYLHLRQARMSLLEQDKIGLRITVPFNPILHVGNVISVEFLSKDSLALGKPEYGTGEYLICSLSHNYKAGGFGTTTLDCVSETVASGVL